jgi:periplasmic divalent cation tolerance protein
MMIAMKKIKYIIVFVTVPDKKTAAAIIKAALSKKLAACVSASKNIDSFYCWKGKIERSKESLLVIKTVKSKFSVLKKAIENIHPYEVPEIIAADISEGNKDYLDWIKEYAG